MNNNLYAQLKH